MSCWCCGSILGLLHRRRQVRIIIFKYKYFVSLNSVNSMKTFRVNSIKHVQKNGRITRNYSFVDQSSQQGTCCLSLRADLWDNNMLSSIKYCYCILYPCTSLDSPDSLEGTVSITTVSSRLCFMTPAARQKLCPLPRGKISLHWFFSLEAVQRSTPYVFDYSERQALFLMSWRCNTQHYIVFSNYRYFLPGAWSR